MNDNKSSIGKAVFYAMIFFASLIVSFMMTHMSTEATGTVAMTEASLPVVMMQTEDEKMYNRLYGYTSEIDDTLLNMELTIVPQDLNLDVVIDTYNEAIQEISYNIRAKKDYSLIEDTVVDKFETNGNQVHATFNIKNLIRDEEEYMLEVVLKTDKYESISYYSKLVKDTGFKVQDKINFVLNFNACTFDEARLTEITRYLETKSSADNGNYGKVDINNTRAMVGWGDLKPFVESNIVPSLHMIDNEVAIVTLDYTIGAENESGGYDTFVVHEFYRIRQTSLNFYLLNFDRQTTQVFDSRGDLISTGKINLGVAPDTEVEAFADAKNNFVYFENCGSLWCFDKEKHIYSKVFAFESEDTDNVRERYDSHDIKILSVKEDGSGYFLVYGYMNRGAHEGQVGVSLYQYNYPENVVTEEIYIPVQVPFSILSSSVNEIAYVTAENSLYIKIDDVLYQIDLLSKETMTEIKGLTDGNYNISDNGKIIAYHVNGEINNADSIRVFNIEAGTDHYINATEGEKVKGLGFVVNDYIYGVAATDNIVIDAEGDVTFAMHKLNIIDSEYNAIRDYEPTGAYIVGANVDEYRINLERVVKDDAGAFVSASIDQLINREENVDVDEIEISTITTDARKRQVVIVLAGGFEGGNSANMRTADKIEYKNDTQFELPEGIVGADKFYVKGYGSYYSAYTNIADAVIVAYNQYGEIYDCNNSLVWKRFKVAQNSLVGLASPGCDKANSYDVARKIVETYGVADNPQWIKADGVSAENMLPFVGLGCPVIGSTLDGYVIITGYTSTEITYLDTMTGKSVTVSYSDANKLFSQAGNTFLTYYKK